MITFRILANDLGTSEIFLIDGRRSGFIAYNVFNGTWTVYFSDMADAPTHVALERLDLDGGIYAFHLPSRAAALALLQRAYPEHVIPVLHSLDRSLAPLTGDADPWSANLKVPAYVAGRLSLDPFFPVAGIASRHVSDGRQPLVTPAVRPAVQDASRPVSQTPDLGAVFANALVADIAALVRHHVGPVSPGLTGLSAFSRSVPAPLARDVATSSPPRLSDAATDRATLF